MIKLTAADNITKKRTSVALGIFDGVHRGHSAVIEKAAAIAAENRYSTAVCTFKTGTITTKGSDYLPIYSDDAKCVLMEEKGVDYIYLPDFSDIKDMSPEDFVSQILMKKMNAAELVCGRDFRFGKGASCDTDKLSGLCEIFGMKLNVVDDVCHDGIRISSARIRHELTDGNIEEVNRLLGHDYAVNGAVINGNRIGRTIDFPTANQLIDTACIMPKFGVYASYAEIDGVICKGVTNIGVKPTVETNGMPIAETHFLNYRGDLYQKKLTVRMVEFIRPEMHFSNINELKAQIKKDVEYVNKKY